MRYNHVHMGTCDVGCSASWRHGARIGRAARNSRTFWTIRASITVRKKKNIRCFSKMDGAKQIIYWLNACSILIRWYLRHKCWHAWSCQIWGFVHQQIYGKKKGADLPNQALYRFHWCSGRRVRQLAMGMGLGICHAENSGELSL